MVNNQKEQIRLISQKILHKLAKAIQREDTPKIFLISRELKIYPSADVVFSFLHSFRIIFAALMGSIMGEEINMAELEVKSQVTMVAAADFHNASVRLDVRGITQMWLMAAEMQNDPRKALTDDRSPYYHAVVVASQEVDGMRYDKLKAVCVTFIMPSKELKNASGIKCLEWADVDTGEFIENSDRRYFLYVPNILKNETIKSKNPTLYMFARFYAVQTQEDADEFLKEYSNDPIARRLIHMHNVLYEEKINIPVLNGIPYFDRRALLEAKEQAEQKALLAEQKLLQAEQMAEQKFSQAERIIKNEAPELYEKLIQLWQREVSHQNE